MDVDPASLPIDEPDRLDEALRERPAARERLLEALLGSVPWRVREVACAALARGPAGMRDLSALGRPALWLSTEALLEVLPGQRLVPFPPHERWDALVEIHREAAEAPWLLAGVFAALHAGQRELGARVLMPVERRFGLRGWAILRCRAADAPLRGLIAQRGPMPSS